MARINKNGLNIYTNRGFSVTMLSLDSDILLYLYYNVAFLFSSRTKQREGPPSLYVMSIKSSGTMMNQTSISIRYVATPEHTTEWTGFRGSMAILRSGWYNIIVHELGIAFCIFSTTSDDSFGEVDCYLLRTR